MIRLRKLFDRLTSKKETPGDKGSQGPSLKQQIIARQLRAAKRKEKCK